MYVIARKAFQFVKGSIVENPISKERMHNIEETFVVLASPEPQKVPDWIKDDGLFALAVKDKALMEVVIVDNDEADNSKKLKSGAGWAAPVGLDTKGK